MRKILIIIALIFSNSTSVASPLEIGKKWPVFWKLFKSQPKEEYKKYMTVKFTTSMEEACKQHEDAWYNANVASLDFNLFSKKMENKKYDYSSSEEYKKEFYRFMAPHTERLTIANIREVTTAVEILRQAGYSDWKKYSRWDHLFGVGDLYREKVPTISDSEYTDFIVNHPYIAKGKNAARKECKNFGYAVKYREIDRADLEHRY